ncbi:MAG: serine hydrolase, partial [Deinococcales bacterium]
RVTANSWRDEVTLRIIEPLDLTHTSLPRPGDAAIAEPYMRGYGMVDGVIVDQSHVDPSMAGAAGGGALVSNTADLTTCMTALLSGKLFRDPATLGAMTTFVDVTGDNGQTGYGLGLERYVLPGGLEAIGHSGGTAGYLSFIGRFPTHDVTLAVSVDAQVDPTPVIMAALHQLVPPTGGVP